MEKKTTNTTEIVINGVNPNTENEFLFYNFVNETSAYFLDIWLKKMKELGYMIKPTYEEAIHQKIETGRFTNPHKFPEYFNSTFDYIAIDFETANNSRLSACAIGLCFIKNNKIVFSKKHYIKPPQNEKFLRSHTRMHGITQEDVEHSASFEDLWKIEFHKYFCNNLIVFHNSSMDLSILKKMFEYYGIEKFDISYIDTMYFAEKLGYPKKIADLALLLGITMQRHHDPKSDAETCANIFGELSLKHNDYKEFIKKLNSEPEPKIFGNQYVDASILKENEGYITTYSINNKELQNLDITSKNFVITGEFKMNREDIANFLEKHGGLVKSGITSKVDFVLAGENCGWSKVQKINELNTSGKANIKVLNYQDLYFLINKYE